MAFFYYRRISFLSHKIAKWFRRVYYYVTRFMWPVWYYGWNRSARACWKNAHYELSDVQKEITDTLKRDGIAVVPLSRLFPHDEISPDAIYRFAQERLQDQSVQQHVAEQKVYLQEKRKEYQGYTQEHLLKKLEKKSGDGLGRKGFLVSIWDPDESMALDFANPLLQMILSDRILGIVNSYMGMCAKFVYYNLLLTIPVPEEFPAYFSQRWHRDPDDIKIVKVFLYLSDVPDDDAGPFCYVTSSHLGGRWRHLFPQSPPNGKYPKPGEVEKNISIADIRAYTGKAWTLIFCDTSGLHKGGHSIGDRERIMWTGMFTSQASLFRARFSLSKENDRRSFSLLVRHALS